jgi:radical SAM protein with 4Fe4S-binding SPASM domain
MHPLMASKTPRILWVEVTSNCPLDCVFCSRKTRRGAGEHMPYDLFESIVRQISDPRIFLLNYSGESTVYPDLIPAVRLARSTGASVELVSALVNVAERALPELCESGLSRLTVSLHTTDAARYSGIYGYGAFESLRIRLTRFLELCRESSSPPVVDLAFVAMDCNLDDLSGVATFAQALGLREISIFPVIRRDEIPVQFSGELTEHGTPRPDFVLRVRSAVERAASDAPGVSLTVCNPTFTGDGKCRLGEVPSPYPGRLPADGRIYSCEQNPWETAHVLSNGDVAACEVLDQVPLGNVKQQSIEEIWNGERYRAFRAQYHRGDVPECQSCPWKLAYRPGRLESDIIASRGRSAQLLHGWHQPTDERHIWASQQTAAVIAPRKGSRVLHVSGMLPPGPEGDPNELVILCNHVEIGRVANPWAEVMPFGLDFPVEQGQATHWFLEFRTRHLYRPSGRDQRDLGFAMVLLTSKPFVEPEAIERSTKAVRPLPHLIHAVDAIGRALGRCFRQRGMESRVPPLAPGLSVLVPERDNVRELSDCLASVQAAARQWPEPIEIIVIVNGAPASAYASLQEQHPGVCWQFSAEPLGFRGAIRRGLRLARFDWVYLLNSDMVLEPGAFEEAGRCRSTEIFSVASQIVLKDGTRFRDETNWTALFVEDGLVTTHDRIPRSGEIVDGFYAGGGASLFQKRLLRCFARVSAYEPFYWEDVEWGWRARKLGYRSLFCARSVAHHTRRSTIDRYFSPEEIDRVLLRNRFLFQLRNLTTTGSLSRLCEELSCSPGSLGPYFLRPSTLWEMACGRLWNHTAPRPDEDVLRESD